MQWLGDIEYAYVSNRSIDVVAVLVVCLGGYFEVRSMTGKTDLGMQLTELKREAASKMHGPSAFSSATVSLLNIVAAILD